MIKIARVLLFTIYFTVISFIFCIYAMLRPYHKNTNYLFSKVVGIPSLFILGIKLAVEGDINADSRPSVIIANHQHNLDLLIVAAHFKKETVTIGKNSILYIPFFGLFYKFAANILVDRKNAKKALRAMNEIGKFIKDRAISVFVFPEGTRNQENRMLKFKRGAFISAIDAKAPIIPCVVERYTNSYNPNSFKMQTIRLKVLPIIETKHMEKGDAKELAIQCQELMEKELTSL